MRILRNRCSEFTIQKFRKRYNFSYSMKEINTPYRYATIVIQKLAHHFGSIA